MVKGDLPSYKRSNSSLYKEEPGKLRWSLYSKSCTADSSTILLWILTKTDSGAVAIKTPEKYVLETIFLTFIYDFNNIVDKIGNFWLTIYLLITPFIPTWMETISASRSS